MKRITFPFRSFYTKGQEFRTWLLEERKINPEAVSKDQEKKEFLKFVEDFNTGTPPILYLSPLHLHSFQQRFHMKNTTTWKPTNDE